MDDSIQNQNSSTSLEENEGTLQEFRPRTVQSYILEGSLAPPESSLSSPTTSSSSSLYSSSAHVGSSMASHRSSTCSSLTEEDLSLFFRMNLRDREGRTIHGAAKETIERVDEPLWYCPRWNVSQQAVLRAPVQEEGGMDKITASNLDSPKAHKVFEFSKDPIIPPLFPMKNSSLPRTLIHVYSDRKINFSESLVQFIIQVINAPVEMELHPRMFQAMVQTPNGQSIPCRIRTTDNFIINSFHGSFKSDESFGNYEVHVRMIIPMDFWARYKNLTEYADGVIHGSTMIPVSRNYGLESQRDCLKIRCEYIKIENRLQRSLHKRRDNSSVNDQESTGASAAGSLEEEQTQPLKASLSSSKSPQIECKLWGLTCDLRNNNLFYADRESHQVHCISPRGDILLTFGRVPGIPLSQQLHRPCGIRYDQAHQRLIVCDKDNHRICFFSLDGHYISSFGQRGYKNGFFEYPWDVTVSRDGQTIAVADSKNKRIQLFDRFGNYLNKYTVFEVNPFEYRSQFDCPRGLCFDDTASNIFVTDFHVNNVVKIPVDCSRHEKMLPYGTVFRPQGIQLDCVGNLLVVDSRHDCLRHMNARGEHLTTIREITKQPLSFPINVTTMAGGFVALLNGNGSITIF